MTEPVKIPNTPMRFLWYTLQGKKGLFFLTFISVTIAQTLSTSFPYILSRVIDNAQGVESQTATVDAVWFWGLAFPITFGVMYLFWRISGFLGMRVITAAVSRSYQQLFAYLGRHSHTYFGDRFAGSLSSKISHASDGAHSLLDSFIWNYYPGVLALILTFFYILDLSPLAGGIFVLMLVILLPVNIVLARYRRPHVIAFSLQSTKMRGRMIDSVTNMSAVRQFVQHQQEEARFNHEVKNMQRLDLRQWGISEWGLTLNNFLIVLFELGLIVVIISLWTRNQVTTGEFVMVMTLLLNISGTLVFIGNSINRFIRYYADVEEGLGDILLTHEIADSPDAKSLMVDNASIKWQKVNFEFGENKVFQDFNLDIKSGQRIGLVGSSGAGKTTFVSLLLRQHELTGGAILLDGQNIAAVTQDSLREHIAIVPQEPMLFHRTIKENIAYGMPTATDEDIIAVAKKAQAHDFIVQLEKGYDTLVGERGIKLSGGQKQRVAIARAMLKDAPILILDEATSALDSESEVAIQTALHELMVGKTVVAIAHRLSTLREMDRIIVLEGGKIIEDGTHEQLKDAGGVYQRLWHHQAGGFMLE
jgi:ATP-binding cassette subfamily B protein